MLIYLQFSDSLSETNRTFFNIAYDAKEVVMPSKKPFKLVSMEDGDRALRELAKKKGVPYEEMKSRMKQISEAVMADITGDSTSVDDELLEYWRKVEGIVAPYKLRVEITRSDKVNYRIIIGGMHQPDEVTRQVIHSEIEKALKPKRIRVSFSNDRDAD